MAGAARTARGRIAVPARTRRYPGAERFAGRRAEIPVDAHRRCSGRLLRHQGPGSVSLARRPGFNRHRGLDRSPEQSHFRLSRKPPAARSDPQATDGTLGLSAYGTAGPRGRSAVVFAEHRPAATGSGLPAGELRLEACSGHRPQPALPRRLGGHGPMVAVSRWTPARILERGGRLRHRGHSRPRPRDRQGPRRRRAARQVLEHQLDSGQQGLLLLAVQGHRILRRLCGSHCVSSGLVPLGRRGEAGSPDFRATGEWHRGGHGDAERRRTLAVTDCAERFDRQSALDGRPWRARESRPRRQAGRHGNRRGRHPYAARRHREDRIPLHNLRRTEGPDRRGNCW